MNRYIFETHQEDKEWTRLRMIEAAFDPTTIRKLKETGIQDGWHCLELGPGAGSIMRWMGEAVGKNGRVIGIDKEAKFLDGFTEKPYQVIEGDFIDRPIKNRFDLIHCRYVLIHNKNDGDMLRKMHALLKPGAVAVVEEPDFVSAKMLNDPSNRPAHRVNTANRGLSRWKA